MIRRRPRPAGDLRLHRQSGSASVTRSGARWRQVRSSFEEWTAISRVILRLHAGRLGVPFLPARISGSFATQTHRHSAGSARVSAAYTGTELAAIPAIVPDVALNPCQQADPEGNVQLWGVDGNNRRGGPGKRTHPRTVERIVPRETLRAAPERTRPSRPPGHGRRRSPDGRASVLGRRVTSRDDDHYRQYVRSRAIPRRWTSGSTHGSAPAAGPPAGDLMTEDETLRLRSGLGGHQMTDTRRSRAQSPAGDGTGTRRARKLLRRDRQFPLMRPACTAQPCAALGLIYESGGPSGRIRRGRPFHRSPEVVAGTAMIADGPDRLGELAGRADFLPMLSGGPGGRFGNLATHRHRPYGHEAADGRQRRKPMTCLPRAALIVVMPHDPAPLRRTGRFRHEPRAAPERCTATAGPSPRSRPSVLNHRAGAVRDDGPERLAAVGHPARLLRRRRAGRCPGARPRAGCRNRVSRVRARGPDHPCPICPNRPAE